MTIVDYLIKFDRMTAQLKLHKIILTEPVLAYRVLRRANLTDDHEKLIRAAVSELTLKSMAFQLKKIMETSGFELESRKWISMLYHNPQVVVQVNGRCLGGFAIKQSVRQGCPLSPLLYVIALEPLLRRLRDEGAHLSLHGILLTGSV